METILKARPRPITSISLAVEDTASNQLAWINSILSLQGTLMSAQRTAVTLIAFGLTLSQMLGGLEAEIPAQFRVLGCNLPRDVGLLMIAAGSGTLALYTGQYLRAIRYLSEGAFAAIATRVKAPPHQLTCATAYAIMVLGALAFASVFLSSL